MPWPAHYHLEFGGRRSESSAEIWQCGIRMAKNVENGDTLPFGQELFEENIEIPDTVRDLAYVVHHWFTRPQSCISPSCLLEWVSATWITPSGRPDPRYSYRHSYYDPAPELPPGPHHGGGSPNIVLPFQSAVVITWGSKVRTRGPGSRGRIFSPAPTVLLDRETGLFSEEQARGIVDGIWYLVFWMRKGAQLPGYARYPSILSPAGESGHRSRIDWITVDTRVDVLRKRAEWQDPTRINQELDWAYFNPDLPPYP